MREGWTETTLGAHIKIVMGQAPPGKDCNKDGVGVPFVKAGEFTDGFPLVREWTTNPLKFSKFGDTLICVVGATCGKLSKGIDCAIGRSVAALQPLKTLDGGFLFNFMARKVQEMRDGSRGSAQGVITKDDLADLPLELPPLVAQRRIVDVVSSVDAYIDALQKQAESARTARNAVLHELLSVGGDDWTETTLGKTLEIARGGSPRPIKDYITSEEDGINWVKIGDASASSKYIYRTEQKIRSEGVPRSRPVKIGDFILSNSMSFGRPYIMRTDGCIHDGWLLFSKVEKHFDEDFLYNLLMSDLVQKQFDSLAAGSGVRNLNIEVAKEVVIPLPPLKVQRRIAEIANGLDEFILAVEQALVNAKVLRSGLLSDLLSGEHEIPASYDSLLGAA